MPYPIKRTPYSPDRIAGTVIEALIIDSVSPVESVESLLYFLVLQLVSLALNGSLLP
jgi:hypothetical protein